MSAVNFTVDFSADDLVARLKSIVDEPNAKPSILGKAVAAGAKVVYDELHKRVPFKTGLLKGAVYRYFDPAISPSAQDIHYRVGVNVTKAPHWWLAGHGHNVYEGQRIYFIGGDQFRTRGGKKPKGGRVVRHIKGNPYLEPAWEASREKALDTIRATYMRIAVETINGRNTG